MNNLGREELGLLERLARATERNADASENLIKLAEEERNVQIEAPPPFCPSCSRVDPVINMEQSGEGTLSDFVMKVLCAACNTEFFAIPESWVCVMNPVDVSTVLSEKGGENGSVNIS